MMPLNDEQALISDPGAQFNEAQPQQAPAGIPEGQLVNQEQLQAPANAQPVKIGSRDRLDEELKRLIQAPAPLASFSAKQEALYERALRTLPGWTDEGGQSQIANLTASATRGAVTGEEGQEILAALIDLGKIEPELAKRVFEAGQGISIQDLRDMHAAVNECLSKAGADSYLNRMGMMELRSAISEDIESGILDYANRVLANNASSKDSSLRSSTAASLKKFRGADTYAQSGIDRLGEYVRSANTQTTRQAAGYFAEMSYLDDNDERKIAEKARSSFRPEEWGQVSELIIRHLGQSEFGGGRVNIDGPFSIEMFLENWSSISQKSRNALLGAEHAKAIESLVRSADASALPFENIVDGADGPTGFSLLASRPQYARWFKNYLQISKNLNVAKVSSHIEKLEKFSEQSPELVPVLGILNSIPESNMPSESVSGNFDEMMFKALIAQPNATLEDLPSITASVLGKPPEALTDEEMADAMDAFEIIQQV